MVSCRRRSLPGQASLRAAKLSPGWIANWTRSGPMYLRQPAIARLVVESIHKGVQLGHYELYAYVVLGNHVHILIHPRIDVSRLLKSLKGATARGANRLLRRTGEPFWQKESYDHWVRDEAEFRRIRAYIENNPVKIGLVKIPEKYPWSSASVEKNLDAARTSACATKLIPGEATWRDRRGSRAAMEERLPKPSRIEGQR
jgi:REP element-mobilizing transposase RayT